MSYHSVDEVVEEMKDMAARWRESALHGNQTPEECADDLEQLARDVEES